MSDKNCDSLTDKADAAFRQAAAKVIDQARLTGTPIIIWENGRAVERTWQEMSRDLAIERRS